MQAATILFDVTLRYGQPKTGTLRPCGEEGLAHGWKCVRRDARSGVRDIDHYQSARLALSIPSGAYAEPAALWHGIDCVGDDLDQRLLDLDRIYLDQRQVRGKLQVQFHTSILQELRKPRHYLLYQPSDALARSLEWCRPR